MSEIRIYVEGGGNGKDLQSKCREGFRKLLENTGFKGRVPRIVACGSRNEAYSDFCTAQAKSGGVYIALIVDSEDPVADIEATWAHLAARDNWMQPPNATDDQVFLMTTCMETWIITDRASLASLYRADCLQTSSLPSLNAIETRNRHTIQDALVQATRRCKNAYAKNRRSFEALGSVDPETLKTHLPSFERMARILDEKLP